MFLILLHVVFTVCVCVCVCVYTCFLAILYINVVNSVRILLQLSLFSDVVLRFIHFDTYSSCLFIFIAIYSISWCDYTIIYLSYLLSMGTGLSRKIGILGSTFIC